MSILLIAIGGAIGALLRYGISGIPQRYTDTIFPLGILGVNLLGALLIGILWGVFDKVDIASDLRTFLFVGVLGAFTTYSTYSLDTMNLFRDGEIKMALLNIVGSNVGCIALVFIGFFAARSIVGLVR